MTPKPGEMHEVDEAFYKLTVTQRDAAWRLNEELRDQLARAEVRVQKLTEELSACHSQDDKLKLVAKFCDQLRSSSKDPQKQGWVADYSVSDHLDKILGDTNASS